MENARILAAILNKWLQPVVQHFTINKLDNVPAIIGISNKIKSTGWVSPQWSLGKELSPLLGDVSGIILEPMITKYLYNVPDDAIPKIAHDIVDNAIKKGSLTLFEGNVAFELEDLQELKKMLNINLPYQEVEQYKIKTDYEV